MQKRSENILFKEIFTEVQKTLSIPNYKQNNEFCDTIQKSMLVLLLSLRGWYRRLKKSLREIYSLLNILELNKNIRMPKTSGNFIAL